MALKDKKYYHNIDLLQNYIKNALTNAGTDDNSIVNLKQLQDSFVYDTVKALNIKNAYTSVGGIAKGTDVSSKTLKDLFDMMFFTAGQVTYTLPLVLNGFITVRVDGIAIKTVPFGSSALIGQFIDYSGNVELVVGFDYIQNDGGVIDSLQLNGTEFVSQVVTTDDHYTLTVPLNAVVQTITGTPSLSIGIGYAAGAQKFDELGNPSGTPLPAGVITFSDIISFQNLSYPVFYKKFTSLTSFIASTFNYQTDADGFLTGNNYVNTDANSLLVIGVPNIAGNSRTILERSVNISDVIVRREINISSTSQVSNIPYKLYYIFTNVAKTDVNIGEGADLSKLAPNDTYSWIGVENSLQCTDQGNSDAATFTLIEKLFGSQKTTYVILNDGSVPGTTAASCLIKNNPLNKIADISFTRYTTAEILYSAIKTSADAKTLLNAGTEPVYQSDLKATTANGTPITNKGFTLFQTGYGYAVMQLKNDDTYSLLKFPRASTPNEDWRIVSTSGACEILLGQSTGYFLYNQLELYVGGTDTGIFKDNVSSDPDYIAPLLTGDCLKFNTTLGTGINNSNNQYQNLITCNNQLSVDKTTFGTTTDFVVYGMSQNNSLCYTKVGTTYQLAGKQFVYYTMVQLAGSYYKILKVNPDSSWQYYYYFDNSQALVPTTWLGYVPTGTCNVSDLGTYTGYMNFTDIYEVFADNNFQTPVSDGVYFPNGTGGHNVPDVLSDFCKAPPTGDIEDIEYDVFITRISNDILSRNKRYRIIDFQTVSEYANDIGTKTILSGTIEPLVVQAISSNTISPLAFSELHPSDIIYYNYTNTPVNNLYVGSTTGYITKRIDTLNNNEFDFDFRGMRSASSTRLAGLNTDLVVSADVLSRMGNSKIILSHSSDLRLGTTNLSQGSRVMFEKCTITNSTISISGHLSLVFSDTDDNNKIQILDSTLNLSTRYNRVYTYVNGKPTVLSDNSTQEPFWLLSLSGSTINTQMLYLGTTTSGKISIPPVLSGFVYQGKCLAIWRSPVDGATFAGLVTNPMSVNSNSDTTNASLPVVDGVTPGVSFYKTISFGKVLSTTDNITYFDKFISL